MTSEQRSRVMRAVKGKDTGTEMTVRRIVHRMGYRYRLHRKDLPGKPDLVFGPATEGDFRAWMFLARSHLQAWRPDTQGKPTILDKENHAQQGA